MNNQNICKIYTPAISDSILIHCFVYETELGNMRRGYVLPHNRMLLATRGDGVMLLDGERIQFGTGSLIFAFCGEKLLLSESNNATFVFVDFSGLRAETLMNRFGINHDNRYFKNFEGMIPFWKENLLRASPETIDLAAESVLLHTLSRMKSEKTVQNEIIASILNIIENNFNDNSLSIVSISENLSYHHKYLSHLFKKEVGVGFSEYLRDKRINYARTLFDHGIDSIKNVAFLSGFNDPLYFSTVFKKVTGISPKEYLQKQEKTATKS